jgi:hypothetical protein
VEAHQPHDSMRFEYETPHGHVIAQLLVDYTAQLMQEEGNLDIRFEDVDSDESSGDEEERSSVDELGIGVVHGQSNVDRVEGGRESEGVRREVVVHDKDKADPIRRRSHILRTASSQDYRAKTLAATRAQVGEERGVLGID